MANRDSSWKGDRSLPQIDRDFRKAVVSQHQAAERATLWYTEVVPSVLDQHQQNAEHIQSFLMGVCSHYSDLEASLSTSCSTGLNAIASFVSSRFISSRHEETQAESEHYLLQKCEYRNYAPHGSLSLPVCGLGPDKTANLVNDILNTYDFRYY